MPGACITPIIYAATLPCESQNSQTCLLSIVVNKQPSDALNYAEDFRKCSKKHYKWTFCVDDVFSVSLSVCVYVYMSVCLSVCLSSRCPSEFVSIICGSACVCVCVWACLSVFIPVHACERLITRLLGSAFVAGQVSTAAPGVRKHITIILHIISEIVTDRQTVSHCHRRHTDTERLMHRHTKMWQHVISLKQYDRHKNWHDDAEYFS